MKSNIAMQMAIAMSVALFLLMTAAPTVGYQLSPREKAALYDAYIRRTDARHYCGKELEFTMYIICKKTYSGPYDRLPIKQSNSKYFYQADVPFLNEIQAKDINEECCTQPCYMRQLQAYCPPP